MLSKKTIVGLSIAVSLLGFPTKAVAEPLEIKEVEIVNIKVYAFEQVLSTWGSNQWDSFDKLIDKESDWKSEAKNNNSSAYGLGQLLDATWKDVGCIKTDIPEEQIDCTIKYISQRYKTPEKALKFHNQNNWY